MTTVLTTSDMAAIHQATLDVLAEPGMRILSPVLLDALASQGARVDRAEQVVRFPARLVDDCLQGLRREAAAGMGMKVINGVVSSRSEGRLQAKFGGACVSYFDYERQCVREPTYADMVAMLRLGEALPEVDLVGNPVMIATDADGRAIDPRMRTVKGAALVAQHTSKPGSTEVWGTRDLDFLVRIGCVVRSGLDAYKANPAFITAKETIAPLILPDTSAEVFMALADSDLPCTIIPMPMSGASSPVSAAGNIVIGNAEILGTMVAIRAYRPGAPVSGGVISGILDMATGGASFAAPEAILQDVGFSQLWAEHYGLGCAIGTGYIDAKLPGVQAGMEKTLKIVAATREGHANYPVGILEGGKTFCPEQAMVDLEIARYVRAYCGDGGIDVSDDTLAVDVIRQVGIGGSFLEHEHTLQNFRQRTWFPDLMDRRLSQGPDKDRETEMLAAAHRQWRQVVEDHEPFALTDEQSAEIDAIVREAEDALLA